MTVPSIAVTINYDFPAGNPIMTEFSLWRDMNDARFRLEETHGLLSRIRYRNHPTDVTAKQLHIIWASGDQMVFKIILGTSIATTVNQVTNQVGFITEETSGFALVFQLSFLQLVYKTGITFYDMQSTYTP